MKNFVLFVLSNITFINVAMYLFLHFFPFTYYNEIFVDTQINYNLKRHNDSIWPTWKIPLQVSINEPVIDML